MARPVIRTSALALAACTTLVGLGAGTLAPAHAENGRSEGHGRGVVKNVIYLLGDGMGRTHVTAGRERYYGAAGTLNMERLPVVGQVATYAVEKGTDTPALVTDSASSATAWSSGVKTYNAALGVDSRERRVETLFEQAHAAGMRTGDVSTAEVTDATPAGEVSHALLRGCQGPTFSAAACIPAGESAPKDNTLITPIARQIATNNVADVILGGGLSRFVPDEQKTMEANGYTVLGNFGDPKVADTAQTAGTQKVATRQDLDAVPSSTSKVIGLFNRGNMTVERSKRLAADGAAVKAEPSLPELTAKAIELLDTSKARGKGFILQVEGALIDKRSHANDAAQTLEEIKAFDDAVKVAMDFAAKDGHTLVIVTADHECAGFNIIEKGTFTNAEATTPGTGNQDGGNPANNSTPVRGSQKKDITRSTGINNAPGGSTAGNFAPATFMTRDDGFVPGKGDGALDGTKEASLWLSYLSGNHTGADVPLLAGGPGSGAFAKSLNNTDLYTLVHSALGL